jgi:hypothetical protein
LGIPIYLSEGGTHPWSQESEPRADKWTLLCSKRYEHRRVVHRCLCLCYLRVRIAARPPWRSVAWFMCPDRTWGCGGGSVHAGCAAMVVGGITCRLGARQHSTRGRRSSGCACWCQVSWKGECGDVSGAATPQLRRRVWHRNSLLQSDGIWIVYDIVTPCLSFSTPYLEQLQEPL